MTTARIAELQGNKEPILFVGMNHVKALRFGENGCRCIATTDLNGCHAVAIVSPTAAIVGHIAGNHPHTTPANWKDGDDWVKMKTAEILKEFTANKKHFETNQQRGIVIYGLLYGEPMASQVEIIRQAIAGIMKLPVTLVSYKVYGPGNLVRPQDKGLVLIAGDKHGGPPEIWVESNKIGWAGATLAPA